ncbi:hypothetical protein [Corynebacterium hindlerae]|uniref:hypothetical protein n=1 Tax=Corynebacterium hindlerae TaxID=699041 RepID=UPI003AAB8486
MNNNTPTPAEQATAPEPEVQEHTNNTAMADQETETAKNAERESSLIEESKKYRKRAQAAEEKLEDLQNYVGELDDKIHRLQSQVVIDAIHEHGGREARVLSAKTLALLDVDLEEIFNDDGEVDRDTARAVTEQALDILGLNLFEYLEAERPHFHFIEGNGDSRSSTWSQALRGQ